MTETTRQARRLILDQITELQIIEETARADGKHELASSVRAVINAKRNAAQVRGLLQADKRPILNSSSPLDLAELTERLNGTDHKFAPLMRALLTTVWPESQFLTTPPDSQLYATETCEGRLTVSPRGAWTLHPSRAYQSREGPNLLALLPPASGSSAGTYAAMMLYAATGWKVADSTRRAFRAYFDRLADKERATARPTAFEQGVLTRLRATGRPRSVAFSPLMAALLEALFPAGKLRDTSFFYEQDTPGVRFSVFVRGRWSGVIRGVRSAEGDNLLSLLAFISGADAGWWAGRIMATAMGLQLDRLPFDGLERAISLTCEDLASGREFTDLMRVTVSKTQKDLS